MQTYNSNILAGTFNELIEKLDSLSQEELNTVPFSGSWTAGQVGDHLSKSYDVMQVLQHNTQQTDRDANEKNVLIESIFLDFSIKFQSPDFIVPINEKIEKKQLIENLRAKTNSIVQFSNNEDLTLTCLGFELPSIGFLTRSEWMHFLYCHTTRHIHQLKKIKAALKNTTTKNVQI